MPVGAGFFWRQGMDAKQVKPLAATDDAPRAPCAGDYARCVRKAALDGIVLLLGYALLVFAVDGKLPRGAKVAKFYGLFIALALLFRWMDADVDQLTRVAGFQLGVKLFQVLA
jgi:hypothetical protein